MKNQLKTPCPTTTQENPITRFTPSADPTNHRTTPIRTRGRKEGKKKTVHIKPVLSKLPEAYTTSNNTPILPHYMLLFPHRHARRPETPRTVGIKAAEIILGLPSTNYA
jgi:hypothetical protein